MQRLNSLLPLRPAQRLSTFRPFPKSYTNMSAPSAAETDTQAETVANTSGITTESLQKTLTEKLEAKHVDIEDISGEHHFSQGKHRIFTNFDFHQAGVASHFKP